MSFVINMDCDYCKVNNELIKMLKIRYLRIKFFFLSVNILSLLLSLNRCGIRNVVTDWKILVQFTSKHSSTSRTFFQKIIEAYPPTSSLICTGLFHITLCTGHKTSGPCIDSSIVLWQLHSLHRVRWSASFSNFQHRLFSFRSSNNCSHFISRLLVTSFLYLSFNNVV
jgi:hypothetical protein